MSDLDVSATIDEHYRRTQRTEAPRGYIGASSIGDPCDAFLELALRAFPEGDYEPHLLRIFEHGHLLERVVIDDLLKAGYTVLDRDGSGKQFGWREMGGHVRANADAVMLGQAPPTQWASALVEIKSMNDAYWQKFKRYGVRVSHPHYFDQMTMLMGMSAIHRCLFIAYNKDNSRYHHEWVDFEKLNADFLEHRVERVMWGQARRIAETPQDWRCRECKYRDPCWGGIARLPDPPLCSQCKWSSPVDDGTWHCRKHDQPTKAACNEFSPFVPMKRA